MRDKVLYIAVEAMPDGCEVVTGTFLSDRLNAVYEKPRLYGGKVRTVAYHSAPAELRAKADLVDRCGHPTSAVCLSELLRPPPRPEGAVPASKKDGRGREVRDVDWAYVSPTEQSHMMCRFCDVRATLMRKQGKSGWVPVCDRHAGPLEDR